MTGRLQGRVAVVTGSNSGIGRAIAIAFAREGAKVVCANRSEASKAPKEKDITTHDLIKQKGGEAVFMNVKIADTASVNGLVKEVVQKYGRLDILVNNAGTVPEMAQPKNVWDLTDENLESTLDINFRGTLKVMRAGLGAMIKQDPLPDGTRGRVINIASVFGPGGAACATTYSGTKSAIIAMTKCAAVECGAHKINVNSISPGTVNTSMTADVPDGVRQFLQQKHLIGFGEPEDVAGPAVFLAGEDSRWITGVNLFVDGGYSVT